MNPSVWTALLVVVASPDDFGALLTSGDQPLAPSAAVNRAWRAAPEAVGARASVARARSAVRSAQTGWAPRLDVEGGLRRIGGFSNGSIGLGASTVEIEIPRTQASLTAGVSYSLTRVLLEVPPTVASARARFRAEQHQADAVREALAYETIDAYWRAAEARGAVAVARASLEEAEDQARRLQRMTDAGLATVADNAAAVARRASAQQDFVRATGQEATARAVLNALLGLPAEVVVALPPEQMTRLAAPVEPVIALEARARTTRPELLALAEIRKALEAQSRALWGRRLPQLGIQADATYAQPNPNVIPPREAFDGSWGVGGILSWSPNDAWLATTEDDAVSADLRRTAADYDALIRDIAVAIRSQLAALETSRQTWSAATARIEAAREAYDARRAEFENGRGIYTSVLEAEAELTAARLSKLTGLVGVRLAEAGVDRAVGRLRIRFAAD